MGREITVFIVFTSALFILGFAILAWPNDLEEAEYQYYNSKSYCGEF